MLRFLLFAVLAMVMLLLCLTLMGISGALVAVLIPVLVLASSIFWIWMLVLAIVNKELTGTERLIWVLVIFFLHFIGAVLYFLLGRAKRLN